METSTIALLGSEIALSLYPQLIKLVPGTLETQVAIRCITYSILALMGYFIFGDSLQRSNKNTNTNNNGKNKENVISSSGSIFFYILMGIINIFHILSSYISYKILPSGIAYSLFYTYPILNLLSRTLFFGESFNLINYIYIIIAIIGVYYVYANGHTPETNISHIQLNTQSITQSPTKEEGSFINEYIPKTRLTGLLMGLGSAITESMIYLMVKADLPAVSPFLHVMKTYLLGGAFSIAYIVKFIDKIVLEWEYWATLILFNVVVGFIGYILRFFTIPRLNTLAFNSLIFIGVVFSYIWGYVFSSEKIKIENIFGTLLILFSVFKLNN